MLVRTVGAPLHNALRHDVPLAEEKHQIDSGLLFACEAMDFTEHPLVRLPSNLHLMNSVAMTSATDAIASPGGGRPPPGCMVDLSMERRQPSPLYRPPAPFRPIELEVAPMMPVPLLQMPPQDLPHPDDAQGVLAFLQAHSSLALSSGAPAAAATPSFQGVKHKYKDAGEQQHAAFFRAVDRYNSSYYPWDHVKLEGPVEENKISLLEGNGETFVISGCIRKGTWGKFRGAVHLETDEPFGIKEFRTPRARLPMPGERRNTSITQDADLCHEREMLDRLTRELQVYDVIECHGKAFMAFQWMDGDALKLATSVDTHLERLYLGRALVSYVAGDLHRCHEAGYTHHDVKLANILWNRHGRMALADFGLMRPSRTTARFPGGTPGMYAPEIVAATGYGPNSDVWSLGLTYFDFLMPGTVSPLFWSGWTSAALDRAHALNERFFEWRRGVMHMTGHIHAYALENSPAPFGPYFFKAWRRDAAMTELTLEYALAPRAERDSGERFEARVNQLLSTDPLADYAIAESAARIADADEDKRNILQALRAAREAYLPAE